MPNQETYDNQGSDVTDEEFEQIVEERPDRSDDTERIERDLATEQQFDTQHGAGHTHNPTEAAEQGLTYTPPSDPPVRPGDDAEGAEVAAGFAPDMEDSTPDARNLPAGVDNNDLELRNDVIEVMQDNSETADVADTVAVQVRDGVVTLRGSVTTEADESRLYDIIIELPGVEDVRSALEVAG